MLRFCRDPSRQAMTRLDETNETGRGVPGRDKASPDRPDELRTNKAVTLMRVFNIRKARSGNVSSPPDGPTAPSASLPQPERTAQTRNVFADAFDEDEIYSLLDSFNDCSDPGGHFYLQVGNECHCIHCGKEPSP